MSFRSSIVHHLVESGCRAQHWLEQAPAELQPNGIGDRQPRAGVSIVAAHTWSRSSVTMRKRSAAARPDTRRAVSG
jgi:hypothetical protein